MSKLKIERKNGCTKVNSCSQLWEILKVVVECMNIKGYDIHAGQTSTGSTVEVTIGTDTLLLDTSHVDYDRLGDHFPESVSGLSIKQTICIVNSIDRAVRLFLKDVREKEGFVVLDIESDSLTINELTTDKNTFYRSNHKEEDGLIYTTKSSSVYVIDLGSVYRIPDHQQSSYKDYRFSPIKVKDTK